MTSIPINILIDDRERAPVIHESLAAMDGVTVNIRRLAEGDFQVDRRLLIERKTLNDFAVSVIDGRFFRQMEQLAGSSMQGVLILEGSSRDLNHTGVRREALQGAMVYAGIILGIPILRSLDPAETARLIVYAARQVNLADTGAVKRAGRRPKGKRKRQLYLLQGLPGIGPVRAKRLLNHFGSVRNVLTATPDELAAVSGIGGDIARRIGWTVEESVLPFGDDCEAILDI
jgi:ERCC4-type nuclease